MRDSSPPEATLARLLSGWPGIGAHQKLDAVAAVRAELLLGGLDAHREAPAGHAERLHEAR